MSPYALCLLFQAAYKGARQQSILDIISKQKVLIMDIIQRKKIMEILMVNKLTLKMD